MMLRVYVGFCYVLCVFMYLIAATFTAMLPVCVTVAGSLNPQHCISAMHCFCSGGDVVFVLHGINQLHSYVYGILMLSLFSPHIMCMGLRQLLLLHVCMATGYIMLVGGGPLIAHSTSL